jgi:cytochrome c biogenesis protein CcdA
MVEFPLSFAFSAGMLATVNPCGFVMLPAFVSYQLGAGDAAFSNEPLSWRLARALGVATVVTAGFLVVFAATGGEFAVGGRALMRLVPWAALLIGVVLIGVGVAGFFGKTILLRLPNLAPTKPEAGLLPMFLFGIGYAIASLSCTLPIFLVVVGGALTTGGMVGAFALFLAYGLGMGAVLALVAIATALLKSAVVQWLTAVTPYVERFGAVLLIAAGLYLVFYQLSSGFLLW